MSGEASAAACVSGFDVCCCDLGNAALVLMLHEMMIDRGAPAHLQLFTSQGGHQHIQVVRRVIALCEAWEALLKSQQRQASGSICLLAPGISLGFPHHLLSTCACKQSLPRAPHTGWEQALW